MDHTVARRVLRTYMEALSEGRWAAGWLYNLHEALEDDEGYRWLREQAGGTWVDRDLFVEDPRCTAEWWTGPGHQSRFPCECRTFRHPSHQGVDVHMATFGNGEWFWAGDRSFDAYDDPDEAVEEYRKGK